MMKTTVGDDDGPRCNEIVTMTAKRSWPSAQDALRAQDRAPMLCPFESHALSRAFSSMEYPSIETDGFCGSRCSSSLNRVVVETTSAPGAVGSLV